ncbi:MAG: ComEC family competence protein [Rhodobacteraceae bacterium]|nr:ComEC family competence protein [Paracoccaceae bacterium]
MFFAQKTRYFCWVPIWLACGIGFFFALRFEPDTGHVLWAGVVVFCCLVPIILWRSIWRAVFWIPMLVSLGFVAADSRVNRVTAPKLGWHFYGAVEGTVAHLDRSASNRVRVTLTDPILENTPPKRTPTRLRVSLHSDLASSALTPGARVMLTASLSPPAGPVEPGGFDFQRKAWFLGLGATGYTRLPVVLARPPDDSGFSLRLFAVRMRVSGAIRARLPGQTGAFAAAIITGDRSAIDPAIMADLRRSNLAHLLAISGLHMGLLTGFIFAAVRYSFALFPFAALRLPTKKIAAVIAMLAGLSYLMISGANVATQRAFIMAAVILVAVLLDRPAITLRAVAMAAIVILLWRPESLTGPGFQMSFAATTALVATFEWLNRQSWWWQMTAGRGKFLRGVAALIVSSAVAGAATAPISAFHFNQIAQYGLLANLASVPVMGFVVMPAAVMSGLLSLIGAQGPMLSVMGFGIDWILQVAAFVAGIEGAVTRIPTAPTHVLALLALGAVFLVLWQGRVRLVGVLVAALAFGLWSQAERPAVLITDNGRLVGLQEAGGRALNRAKGNGFAARVWLENDGDAASQQLAAGRRVFEKDDWTFNLGGGKIGYVWNRKALPKDLQERCAQVDVLIAPNLKQSLSGGCETLNQSRFRKEGAIALFGTTEGVGIVSARQVSGTRIWNR